MGTRQMNRIKKNEERLCEAKFLINDLSRAVDNYKHFLPELNKLIAYYESDLWRKDYEDDEMGLIPSDLTREVLSQDGVYDVLVDLEDLRKTIIKCFR